PPKRPAAPKPAAAETATTVAPELPSTATGGSTSTPPAAEPAVAATVGEITERSIVVETDVVRAVFSNRGGVIASWTLKKALGDNKQPVDLVPAGLPESQPRPFSLRLGDDKHSALVNHALFQSSATGEVDAHQAPVTLTFNYEDASGFHAQKTFRIEPSSYVI